MLRLDPLSICVLLLAETRLHNRLFACKSIRIFSIKCYNMQDSTVYIRMLDDGFKAARLADRVNPHEYQRAADTR